MSKIVVPMILIIIFSCFLVLLLPKGSYNSHDGEAHVARFAAYYKAFKDRQILPRWAQDLNYGYGSPLFIFYYPLPGTIASGIHALGISLENSFKVLMAFSFVLAPLAFYGWTSLFVRKGVAFVGSLLYGFAPYHFLDLYVRGDVAEILGFVFVPLVFFYIEKSRTSMNLKTILIGGTFYALLILSHNALSLMFSPVFLSYSIVRTKNKKGLLSCIGLLLTGLFLSAFFWVPALLEAKFTNAMFFIGDMYKSHFPTFQQLVYSQWGFGADVSKSRGLSPQIGPVHIFLAFMSGFYIIRKTKEYKIIRYWFLLFIFVLFLSLRQSDFIWQHVPLLKLFQFPWRFTALSSFIAAVLGLYVLNSLLNKKILIVVGILLIAASLPFVKTKEISTKDDIFYYTYKGSTDYHGAATTIWSAGNPGMSAKKEIEVISGNATIRNLVKRSNNHNFMVDVDSESKILDNTIYFPGWQVFIDGQKTTIEFQDINHRGLITFSVPKGMHNIGVVFRESTIRLFSDILSLFSITIILGFLTVRLCFNFLKKT